jgi:hypothetical protein
MIKINVPAETLIVKKGIMILEHCKVIEKVSNTLIIILIKLCKADCNFQKCRKTIFSLYIFLVFNKKYKCIAPCITQDLDYTFCILGLLL